MSSWIIFVYMQNQSCDLINSIIINGLKFWKTNLCTLWCKCCLLVVLPILTWCLKSLEVPLAAQHFVFFQIYQCLVSLRLGIPSSCLTISIKVANCFDWLNINEQEEKKGNIENKEETHTYIWEQEGYSRIFLLDVPGLWLFPHRVWAGT